MGPAVNFSPVWHDKLSATSPTLDHTIITDEFDWDFALTSATSATRSRSTWLVVNGSGKINIIAMGTYVVATTLFFCVSFPPFQRHVEYTRVGEITMLTLWWSVAGKPVRDR